MIELETAGKVIDPSKAANLEARERYARLHTKILRVIIRHRDGAHIKGERLGEMFSIDQRVVARIVGNLRRDGYCVCSDSDGYCYADTLEQWLEDLEKERGRGISVLDRVSESKQNTVNMPEIFDEPQSEKAA
jgi:biotin operon repressor